MNRLTTAALLLAAGALAGCSLIASFQDRIGSAVARYCEESAETRDALREAINARTAPNRITVECAADPPAAP